MPTILQRFQTTSPGLNKNEERYQTTFNIGLTVGILAHFGFLVLFTILGYKVLALFNIFSVAAFTFGTWRVMQGDMKLPIYLCILFEVPMHAVLCTFYLGFHAGFWLLTFISVAALIIWPVQTRTVRFILCLSMAVFTAVIAVFTLGEEPIYDVPGWLTLTFLTMNLLVLSFVISVIIVVYDAAVDAAETKLEAEHERAETLLLNVLPRPIAERLKAQEEPLADSLDAVTVLFADIAGFTNMSRTLSAEALVTLLNDLFTRFDALADQHGAEKIKTIGDAYMVATGLKGATDHAPRMVRLAKDMQRAFEAFRAEHKLDLGLRTGVHSGAAVAGVIGKQKFAYDLWGDTVNVASRLESNGVENRIQISAETRALLPDDIPTVPRGQIEIKGHSPRDTFLLVADAPA